MYLVLRREEAMQEGLKQAVSVPLSLAESINTLWPSLKEMAKYGNAACKSDIQVRVIERRDCRYIYSIDIYVKIVIYFCLQVAAKALETAVFGAYYNVIINLKDISDTSFRVAVSSFYKTSSYPIKNQK